MALDQRRAKAFIKRSNSENVIGRAPSFFPQPSRKTPLLNVENASEEDLSIFRTKLQADLYGISGLLFTKLNVLLIFVPLGFASGLLGWSSIIIFSFNFVAMIPLASMLGAATEELALHTGDLIGGLLNATFGNAVEMVITVQALNLGLVSVVQGSLLGSILSNLLLVLGMAFFAGGCCYPMQQFSAEGATCSTSLLLLASLSIICPTVTAATGNTAHVLEISRYTALLIAITYVLFLFFQLYTHLNIFKAREDTMNSDLGDSMEPEPAMSLYCSLGALLTITIIIACQSHFLVGSIESVVVNFGLTEGFIGVILLPIVGNAAEHLTAVTVAMKNKIDLTMGVAIGSSTQIAMFMVPFAVLVGWAMDVPMSLAFSTLSATILALSILIVIGVVQDGQSNWFEGVMLMVAYMIIGVVFWFQREPVK